jgi:hypothetical protein
MSMIFQNLLETEKILRFKGITELGSARAGPSQFSFKAEFYYQTTDPVSGQQIIEHDYAWINLGFLPMFVAGSEWQNRVKVRSAPQNYRKVKNIDSASFNIMADLRSGERMIDGKYERASEFIDSWPVDYTSPEKRFTFGATLFSNHHVPYALATSELCRFYIGAFGLIFFELSRAINVAASQPEEHPLSSLVNIESCGWVKAERDTYRISPKPGLLDRASALQLAMLLTDDALLQSLIFMIKALRAQMVYGEDSSLLTIMPQDTSKTLAFELGDPVRFVFGNSRVKSFLPIRRIRRDERELKFKKLIVDVGIAPPLSEFDAAVVLPTGETWVPIFNDNVKITDVLPNNGASRQIGDTGPSFSDCFPSARSVTFQIVSAPQDVRKHKKKLRSFKQRSEEVTTLSDVFSKTGVAKYAPINGDLPFIELTEPDSSFVKTPYFPAHAPEGIVNIERASRQLLDSRMRAFCYVRAELVQEGIAVPLYGDESSEMEPVIRPPMSWGSFANNRRDGSRRMGVMCIPTTGRTYYAFELGQRHQNEFVSMAVMARRDGGFVDLTQLYAFLADACLTKSRFRVGQSYLAARSIWPDSRKYTDIVVEPLTHHARLSRPTALRHAILQTISWLESERYAGIPHP